MVVPLRIELSQCRCVKPMPSQLAQGLLLVVPQGFEPHSSANQAKVFPTKLRNHKNWCLILASNQVILAYEASAIAETAQQA